MPRPDTNKSYYGEMLVCRRCSKPVLVATVTGWYVFYCPTCFKLYGHDECCHNTAFMVVTSDTKGDKTHAEKRDNRSYPGLQTPADG